MSSYATIGYGDVLLPKNLQLVGAVEGMVGTLMFGWSVAILVSIFTGIIKFAQPHENKNSHQSNR